MKTIAYTALHYGVDYLAYAIRPVIGHVDEYWVLYAAQGSHGSRTDRPCPDSRSTLYAIAEAEAGDKLHWYDGEWTYEGAQRDEIHRIVPDADVVLVLDSDEIWAPGLVKWAIEMAIAGPNRTYRMPMVHFWRSFYRAILHDPAFPIRAIVPGRRGGEGMIQTDPIAHMGYAQRSEIVEYKQHTHGHKGGWRRDCDWFRDRFLANAQRDCHPVGSEYWNPEPVDPWDHLPAFMKAHPYAALEVIP